MYYQYFGVAVQMCTKRGKHVQFVETDSNTYLKHSVIYENCVEEYHVIPIFWSCCTDV
jgi:hypothetical protein